MEARNLDKITNSFFLKLEENDKPFFFNRNAINALEVLEISKQFKLLKIKDENLLFLYSKTKSISNASIVLTNKNIHTNNNTLPLSKEGLKKLKFDAFSPEHTSLISTYINDVLLGKVDEQKTLADFTKKFKDFINEKESLDTEFEIDLEFLEILKKEGDKISTLVEDLSENKNVSAIINTMISKTDTSVEFKVEHIILQDIIKIFNLIYPLRDHENTISEVKLKFLLAYFFEKLQGKDIINSLSIQRINKFVASEKFDSNIELIKNATFFDLGKEYRNDFFLPSILKRLKVSHFSNSGTILYRIASLITKVDGTVSEEEITLLKNINHKLLHPKEKLKGVIQSEIDEDETLDDAMKQLNELIGLDNVKVAVNELSNFLKVQKIREEKGLKSVNNSLHTVFMGPPGTGKTTVARLLSKIYKHLGYLEQGHLVETDRSGLVAGYVGQTALKTEEVINASKKGVLFIDEAYSLVKDGNKNDFGNEAIEVLLKKMEDYRNEFVVIAAGYPDEMKTFINSNPGLESRFSRYFTFEHYKPKELLAIFSLFCVKSDFVLTQFASEKLEFIFDKLYESRHKNFGNARVARSLFEKIIEFQANRIVSVTPLTIDLLKTITEEDVPPVNKTVEEYLKIKEN